MKQNSWKWDCAQSTIVCKGLLLAFRTPPYPQADQTVLPRFQPQVRSA